MDINGYGIRVPGIVISPYAKQGFIDHQILSHDAYLKFIENVFLGGQRLDLGVPVSVKLGVVEATGTISIAFTGARASTPPASHSPSAPDSHSSP